MDDTRKALRSILHEGHDPDMAALVHKIRQEGDLHFPGGSAQANKEALLAAAERAGVAREDALRAWDSWDMYESLETP